MQTRILSGEITIRNGCSDIIVLTLDIPNPNLGSKSPFLVSMSYGAEGMSEGWFRDYLPDVPVIVRDNGTVRFLNKDQE